MGAQQMRSPLVSMIFPSLKTKTDQLAERQRSFSPVRRVGGIKSNVSRNNNIRHSTMVKSVDLENIIQIEAKRRSNFM